MYSFCPLSDVMTTSSYGLVVKMKCHDLTDSVNSMLGKDCGDLVLKHNYE